MNERNDNEEVKEDDVMMTATALKMDNDLFNQFLKANKEKINSIVPKNPSISQSDEWRHEIFWDEDKRSENKNK